MKKMVFAILLLTSNMLMAQNTPGINFQAVARDSYGNPAKDRNVFVLTSIIQTTPTGKVLLNEEFSTTTDNAGVFTVKIGLGKRLGGTKLDLQSIDWGNGPFYLNLKVAITPIAPVDNYDYTKDLVDLGTSEFGSVPYALFAGNVFGFDKKMNLSDTAKMLSPYVLKTNAVDSATVLRFVSSKVNIADSTTVYVTPAQLAAKTFDSSAIYNQLGLKEIASNKSTNFVADSASNTKYPSVKAVKAYIDNSITNSTIVDADATTKGKLQLAGDLSGTASAPTIANNAITTAKILDANVTTSKIADANVTSSKINDGAISTSKILDANITTSKIADANVTDAKIVSVSGSKVTGAIAGNAATATKLATTKNINGVAFDGSADITIAATANTLTGNTLATNITNSSLTGVGILTSGAVPYSLLTGTIPTWNQNTTGNAATATKFASPVTINGVNFDGSANITIASAAANALTMDNSGSGATSGTTYDGSVAKTISYNSIGAEPSIVAGVNTQFW